MSRTRLIVMTGLPGAGKSTVAEGIARALHAPILAVDPIEAAMWRGGLQDGLSGVAAYVVAAGLADAQLALGITTVIDAVNPVEAPRAMWRELAARRDARLMIIECVCGDEAVHRARVEARETPPGWPPLTWSRVQQRRAEFEPWREPHLVLDTCSVSPDELIQQALDHVTAPAADPHSGRR